MKRTLLTLSLLAAAIGGCVTTKKPVAHIGDIPPGSFQNIWSIDSSLAEVDRSYIEGKSAFLYGDSNTVAAFSLDGVPQFRVPIGEHGDTVGPPMVQDKRLIFPTSSTLEVITPLGVPIRTIHMERPPRSPGVLVDETVYIGCDSDTGGRIAAIALDQPYNIYRWTLLTGIVHTQPVVQNGFLYAATEDGRIFALTLDRAPAWPAGPELPGGVFHTDGKIGTAIKVDDYGVYIPCADTKLYCVDPVTGHLKWEYFASVPLTESPVPTTDMVYIPVRGQGIVALKKKTPQRINMPVWHYDDGKQVLNDDGKYVYILTNDGHVVAVEKATGTLRFSSQRNDFVMGVTHVDPKNPSLYLVTKARELVCIQPVLKTGVVGELVMADFPAGR